MRPFQEISTPYLYLRPPQLLGQSIRQLSCQLDPGDPDVIAKRRLVLNKLEPVAVAIGHYNFDAVLAVLTKRHRVFWTDLRWLE